MTNNSHIAKGQKEDSSGCFFRISNRLGAIRQELSKIDKRGEELSIKKKECETDQDLLVVYTLKEALLKRKNRLLSEQGTLITKQTSSRGSTDNSINLYLILT